VSPPAWIFWFVTFQGFARRKIFLLVRRGDESSPTALLCGTRSWTEAADRIRSSCAYVDYILWVRGFRDPTISGRGFNLFKPLRRHFRAGARPERRVQGGEAPLRRDSFRVF
jgi:hypothetical protein